MSVVANIGINVDSSNAVSKLRQVQTQAQATERAFGALQGAIGALGVGFALTKVISDVKELDTNIRRLGTVGVDVGKISPALSNLSKELGGVASKAELAAASYQAASAGFSDTAGNINILRAATKAAVGGLADTQAVTEVLVKTLNSYGMSGNQALQVTDSISKAVELGNQEWSDYTSQLGRVASIAALAGVSLDEVNAFIASATKNGATAEIAFTGLGATLNTLLQPTKESQEAAAKLGIQWNYGGLQAKGFSGLMAELAVAMNKDKEATARLLGSQEAMRGAMAAASKNGTDFKNILGQIGDASGKTDMDFQTMKGSLENTLKALDTAFKNLSEAIGKAFGPTLVIVIRDITGAVNAFADVMNGIPQPVMDAVGGLVKFIAQMLLLSKAIQIAIGLRAGLAGLFASTATGAATAGTASAAATPLVNGLGVALRNLAAIGIVTVGVNYVSNVVGEALSLEQLQKRRASGGAAGAFKGASRETVVSAQTQQKKELERLRKQEQARQEKLKNSGGYNIPVVGPIALTAMSPFMVAEQEKIRERSLFAQGVLGLDPSKYKSATPKPATIPTVPTGGTTNKKAKTDDTATKVAASAAELSTARQLYEIEGRLLEARQGSIQPLILARTAQKELVTISAEAAAIKADKELPAAKKKNELDILALKAASVSRQLAFDISELETNRSKEYAVILQNAQLELALAKEKDPLKRAEMQIEAQLTSEQFKKLNLTAEQINQIRQLLLETDKLKNATVESNQLFTDMASATAGAFGSAIDSMLSGTENLGVSIRKIGADLLKTIAKMLIMQALAQTFSALGGTDGKGVFSFLAKAFGSKNAMGNVFAQNGIVPFAKGGIVNSPTLFPFAKGIGLMGEAGPEAIMPLKRGSDGRLGVAGGGGGSTSVVVNVDASGSNVQGNEQEGKQLGKVLAAAVQAELIKQKRPGGLLA